jgi:hypothetical protein
MRQSRRYLGPDRGVGEGEVHEAGPGDGDFGQKRCLGRGGGQVGVGGKQCGRQVGAEVGRTAFDGSGQR